MIDGYKSKAIAASWLFNIATLALLVPTAQAHDHDTTRIPNGETVSLEPLVRYTVEIVRTSG
jgi:hypothetical protein